MKILNFNNNFFLFFSFLVIIIFTNISKVANAMQVDNLYTVELPAKDQTAIERKILFLKGFDRVLLKLTNFSQVTTEPRIKAAREQIDKYVNSFAYKEKIKDDLQIKIIFNETMINTLLKVVGKSYLGKSRPSILVWLLMDTATGEKLIEDDKYEFFVTKLEKLATEHAIPLVLPLLDLDERTKIKVTDVLMGAPIILAEAVNKYNADIVLVGKITELAGQWRSKWNMFGSMPFTCDTQGKTLDEQYSQLMDILKAKLINLYATKLKKNVTNDVVRVNVAGVNSLENYARILAYLRGLTAVNLVEVVDITADGATFELHVKGGENSIKQAISMERLLEQDISLENNILENSEGLHYKVCS